MGKSLIITEKPSVAQEFAKVLNVSGRKDGYIENQNYVITWCVGHLVGLVYPESYDMKYKKWRLEDLPFLPKEYKYDVIKDVSKQYNIVHGMLMREDIERVYWAAMPEKKDRPSKRTFVISAVYEMVWRNFVSGLTLRRKKKFSVASTRQNQCLIMQISVIPELCER